MTGVDIGRAPALSFDAQSQEPALDRRRINMRWLSCTVLTGLTGASLMGGALFIAVDRQSEFAETPLMARAHALEADGAAVGLGKSDRFVIRSENVSSRQVIQDTSVRSVGGKEFVKVTPYVRVTASLAMTRGEHAEQAPPFNPLKIFSDADGGNEEDTVAEGEARDDDSLRMNFTQLTHLAGDIDTADALDVAEIEQTIRETVSFVADDVAYAPPVILPVSSSGLDGFSGINAFAAIASHDLSRSAGSANMTTVSKRVPSTELLPDTEEIGVEVQRGDTLMSILTDHGATRSEAMQIASAVEEKGGLPTLREGQQIRITVAPAEDDPERHRPIQVSMKEDDGTPIVAATADLSALMAFAPAGRGSIGQLRRSAPLAPSGSGPRANVYDGIYETGLEHDVPRPLVDDLIRIFSFDVDFQRTVSLGDTLEVFYAETGEQEDSDEPEILYASIGLRGEMRHFYRFRTPDDGQVDYYDETGTSAKKFLMRKPISSGTFRSGFGTRRHPILGYSRMHAGVDWSARTGTPIMASGNGTVVEAQWSSGYGRHIRLRHANGYESTYSHMSEFAKGLKEGDKVRQGQVIGYVGSTGLSTGPHLHYEVLVNGRHVDPMRIRLPRGRILEGRILAAFEKEKARIQALMHRAPASTRIASR